MYVYGLQIRYRLEIELDISVFYWVCDKRIQHHNYTKLHFDHSLRKSYRQLSRVLLDLYFLHYQDKYTV
eukprot:UN32543